jgi:DNA-binding NtrC family response regulator
MMPGMTGVALAGEIARLRPGLPVLLASGFAEVSETEMGSLPRLAKPFTQAALAQAVSDVLRASAADANVVALRGSH